MRYNIRYCAIKNNIRYYSNVKDAMYDLLMQRRNLLSPGRFIGFIGINGGFHQ